VTLAHWDEVEGFEIPETMRPLGGRWQRLADAAGSVRLGVHRVVLERGGMMTPPHRHSVEEEMYFVLAGSATYWQEGSTCAVAAGDTIVCTAGAAAHTLLAGDEGVDVLVVGTRSTPEAGLLPRTNVAWFASSPVAVDDAHPWEAEAALGVPHGEPGERPPNVVALDGLEGDFGGIVKHPGRAGGSKLSGLNWVALPPDEEGAPPHCHSADEEAFVVLDGEGTLELWGPPRPGAAPATEPQETHPVRRGHVVARPAGTRISHCFRSGASGLTYLAYGTREPNDMCYYPRSNKVFFRGLGLIARLDPLAYDDGEPG
jgi:uncharacterized cupin superfamily protein